MAVLSKAPKGLLSGGFIQWNIRGINSNREELLILKNEFKPLVFCLQETKVSQDNLPKIKGYNLIYQQNPKEGIAIYVKTGIPTKTININTPLRASAVRITINNRPLTLCSIHIPDTINLTVEDLESITKQLPKPFMFLGDLNAHNPLWGCKELKPPRGRVVESFITKNDISLYNDKSITYIGERGSTSSLDLSMCSPDIFLDYQWNVCEDQHGSDHFPILISPVENIQIGCPRKYVFQKADWQTFSIEADLQITQEILDDPSPLNRFTETLLNIADKTIPKTSGKPKSNTNPWFNDECKQAKSERKKATENFLKTPDADTLNQLKIKRAQARRTIKQSKRESWRKYMATINLKTQAKRVWNLVKSMSGKSARSPVHHLVKGNGLAETEEEIAETLAETFEQHSSFNNQSKEFIYHKTPAEKVKLNFKSNRNNTECYNKIFSMKDLRKAIKRSKRTATGDDNIHYELLKHLPASALYILLQILNKLWTDGTFPDIWKLSIIIPIPKPNKDHSIPSNYRPIALTSCLCKTMERMINDRLLWYLEIEGNLS